VYAGLQIAVVVESWDGQGHGVTAGPGLQLHASRRLTLVSEVRGCAGIFVSMKKRCHQRTYTQPAEIEKIDALMMPINFGITWQKTPKLSLAAFFPCCFSLL
jgi:hypothetical protein